MNKIITIITPSLNQGCFLDKCISSIIEQKGDFFIDYLIIDGGSTDNSIDIIKKYDYILKRGDYPKRIEMRWRSEPDSGQSNAINKGLKMAKGDILGWLNSDDYYESGALDKIARVFTDNHDVDLIFGNGYIVDEKKQIVKSVESVLTTCEEQLKRGCTVFQPSAFFTRRIINQIGLLDENLHYVMDYDLWLRIMRVGKVLHVPSYLSNFREWDNSKTVAHYEKFLTERKMIYKKYGGNMLDREIICRIKDKFIVINLIKRRFPRFYILCKRILYFFIDMFHYKKDNYAK